MGRCFVKSNSKRYSGNGTGVWPLTLMSPHLTVQPLRSMEAFSCHP